MSSKPARYSPVIGSKGKNEKTAGIPAVFPLFQSVKGVPLEPLGAASAIAVPAGSAVPIPVVTAIPVKAAIAAIAIHHAVLEAAVAPAPAAKPALHMRQDRQAALLAVVEGLVERVGSIGD